MDKTSFTLGWLVGKQIAGMRMVKGEPVAYLYNGVRLPALPEWDMEVYPYAVIHDYNDFLVLTSKPFLTPNESVFGDYVSIEKCSLKRYKLTDGAWVYYDEAEESGASVGYDNLIWSNHDIPGLDVTVYLEATDPIPVYE